MKSTSKQTSHCSSYCTKKTRRHPGEEDARVREKTFYFVTFSFPEQQRSRQSVKKQQSRQKRKLEKTGTKLNEVIFFYYF